MALTRGDVVMDGVGVVTVARCIGRLASSLICGQVIRRAEKDKVMRILNRRNK